jgi:1,2-dihydroxy-3-keto-5-methylthiopentene dioxygenase
MALVRIPAENRTITGVPEIASFLASQGLEYRRFDDIALPAGATADELLAAYGETIDALKARHGYVTADVLDVWPHTPGLDAMLTRFNSEHWHDEDEVRIICEGHGLFHVHPQAGPVFSVEVVAGDLIRVPKGTHHWFDLCADRRIRAIRLFQDPAGWTPRYTESGTDKDFQPLCFGPAYFPSAAIGSRH